MIPRVGCIARDAVRGAIFEELSVLSCVRGRSLWGPAFAGVSLQVAGAVTRGQSDVMMAWLRHQGHQGQRMRVCGNERWGYYDDEHGDNEEEEGATRIGRAEHHT